MNQPRRPLFLALALCAAALALHFWFAPLAQRLPADYSSETRYAIEDHFRDTPGSAWQTSINTNWRVDRTLNSFGETAIIQGNLHSYDSSGNVIFESTGIYGVDRRTRKIISGYGDSERTGYFLFPTHVQAGPYMIWDPMFIGARTAVYSRTAVLDGLTVTVFDFYGRGMDETAGYETLPDVPERYRAHTDGQGELWIDPDSGTMVDYREQGVSYYVNPVTGQRLGDFHTWSGEFTPETRAAQLAVARAARLQILALETWLPGILIALAAVLVVAGTWMGHTQANTRKGSLP
jgi:hypothetical protein